MIAKAAAIAAIACAGTATWIAAPTWTELRELGSWFARPLLLPLAWSAMDDARRHGDAAEAYARGQRVLQLVPQWTDGHAVFAYRYVTEPTARTLPPERRAAAALERLQVALAWLEAARATAGRHEVDLLLTTAFLVELAATHEPGIDAALPAGGAAALADHYLAAAERLRPSAAIREQRTFVLPRLAAGLLASGDTTRALEVLDVAIARSLEVRDTALAAEWRSRLDEARRWLGGDHGVDLGAVRADPRLAPLLPFLR